MERSRIKCTVAGNGGVYYVDPDSLLVYNSPIGGTSWKYSARADGAAYLYGTGGTTVLLPVQEAQPAQVPKVSPPPIGLRPDYLAVLEYDKKRAVEIAEAVQRYAAELHPIPESWLTELNELIERNQPTLETETTE